MKHKKNISFVTKKNLCTGCATCVSICPEQAISLSLDMRKGLWIPIVNEDKCISCELCIKICPGIDADYSHTIPSKWNSLPYHSVVGYYSYLAVAYSKNKIIQADGASGGLVTTFLTHLLKEGFIDGAIVTIMGIPPRCIDNSPQFDNTALLAGGIIARTEDEIVSSQKSKYCPVPIGEILKNIKHEPGRYAFIGLPCHIQALRKWQEIDGQMATKVPFVLGLFCSRTPSFNATRYLLYNRKIPITDIKQLDYRAGEKNIGYMRIKLRDGSEKKVPHLSFDYWGYMFFNFFMPYRCYLCPDKLAAAADISFGDNWTGLLRHPLGTSTIVVRDPEALAIFKEMIRKNLVCAQDIDLDTLVSTQDLKNKAQILPRKKICKIFHKPIPEYGKLVLYSDDRSKSLTTYIKSLTLLGRCYFSNKIKSHYLLYSMGRLLEILDKGSKKIVGFFRILIRAFLSILNLLTCFMPIAIEPSHKRTKYKLIMMGGYGWKDIGDEAMPHAVVLNLKEMLGDQIEIVMLSPDPSYTQKTHHERSIYDINRLGFSPRKGMRVKLLNIRSFLYGIALLSATYLKKKGIHLRLWPEARIALNEITSSDIIFNVGGGNLNSIIPQELYKKGFIYLSARILHKPVIVSGQTIGPFENMTDRLFARLCLNTVHLLTFRDKETSFQRCREIRVVKPTMCDAADDAMTIPVLEKKIAEEMLIKEVGWEWYELKSELVVAMNLKGSLRAFKRRGEISDISKECRLMSEIADAVVERFGAKVAFIPTDYNPSVDDRKIHQEIIDRVKNKMNIRAVNGEYTDIILKSLIGLFDIAIGSRYHFCVFAASMFVPFAGIASGVYQQTKLKGLSDLCDTPQCFVENDMEYATFEDVWPRIDRIIKNRDNIQNNLRNIVPSLKERSIHGVKETVKLLNEQPGN